jgi:hypothetical protein
MNQSHSEPKSAESRESGIVDTASFNTPYAHSDNSAQVGQIAMSVSMHNSFSGELGSENAYHAREDYEIINQLAPHVYEYDDDSSVSSSYTEVSAELTYDEEMAMYRAIEHRNLLRDIRNFFRAEWIDPVRIYSESCMLNDIGLPYEIATRVLEYYTYSPELGFYVTFDMKLREVCHQIRARDFVLTVPASHHHRYVRQFLESEFDDTVSDVFPQYVVWKKRFDSEYEREIERIRKGLDFQDFSSNLESMKEVVEKIKNVNTVPIPEEFYYHLEGACLLAAGLMTSANIPCAVAHICEFARAASGESVAELARKHLTALSWSEQSGGDDWLTLLRNARSNWKLVLNNPHFTNLQNVLSTMVSLGLCQSSDVEFTICGVNMFTARARKQQSTAVDLVDAILTTVVAFVEGGFECFRQRSFRPMLYGDTELTSLEEQCVRCERLFEFAKTGDVHNAEDGMTEAEYFKLLLDTIERLKETRHTAKSLMAQKMISMKLEKLQKQKVQYERICNKAGLRVAPWSFLIYGNSGVGKSSIANILMIASLKANGFPAEDVYLITNNEHDKYDSSLKSYCTGIFFDDMCNTKLEYMQTAPAANIIQTINNVRAYGNMAEADEKGKVLKEPKVVSTTTNVKNLKSTEQSECPLSIERRNAYIVTVSVKDKFAVNGMLNQEKVRKYYCEECNLENIPVVPDLWNLTVEEAIGVPNPTPGRPDLVTYEPICFEGRPMVDVDIRTLLRYNRDASKVHFANQKMLVDNQTNLSEKMDWCSDCRMPGNFCECCDDFSDALECQFGSLISTFAVNAYMQRRKRVSTLWSQFGSVIESKTLSAMEKRLEYLESSPYFQWTNYVPKQWLENEVLQQAILYTNADQLRDSIRSRYVLYAVLLIYAVFTFMLTCRVPVKFLHGCLTFYCLLRFSQVTEIEKARLYARINHENGSLNVTFRKYRDASVSYLTGGCIALGTIYALSCIWKHIRLVELQPQGNLSPTSIREVEERDEEAEIEQTIAKEQGWDQVYVAPLPCSEKSKTATTEQLVSKVYTNQTQFVWINERGKPCGCDLMFMESNIAVLPQHIWKEHEMTVKISRGTKRIQTFEAILSRDHSKDIPGTDLCLVYVPNAGDWADLRDYLPHAMYNVGRNVPARFVYKEMRFAKPEKKECDTVLSYQDIHINRTTKYYGAKYELAFNTFSGLCMGSLISNTQQAMILGFHTAGIGKTPSGAMSGLLRSQYETARAQLGAIPGVCLAASTGTMQPQMYGKPIFTGGTIHEKSPVNDLPDNAHLNIYGSCTGRATYKSSVVETPIADTVSSICGVEKLFGKPKFHLGNAWEKSLLVSCHPSIGVEPSLLVKAVVDYTEHMIERTHKIPELAEFVRPLTRMENLCGIDGLRFIDKINPHSAIGYPLSGAKEPYISRLDPEDFPGISCPAELDDRFWQEADRMEIEYKQGRRCHVPFKACLKDEPTKLTKDKVRVFQASPIALQLVVRKYFLPIVRLLSLFPLDSECGVGINTMGPEFSELVEHMRKFGADRILAGDYSKYDLRMAAQLILAAFDVLISIARSYGYSEEAIVIMRGIATDIAYPVMAYNGDLLQHFGSNPSGQNLTVYINSIVNSLLLRCAFFHILPEHKHVSFREVAAMMTYGDDVKGSIKQGYDEFNHISYAAFLADRDMIFTMPDKESTPTEYMRDEDADFLKRKNVYSEDLNQWMGALDETSIFKSLTSILKSKAISPMEQSMQNIDGALREWFAYGREHYEMRREQMKQVAKQHGISGGCAMLSKDYDDCLEMYRERYGLGNP